MLEIRFKGRPGWYPDETEYVVNRVAHIVCGSPLVFQKEHGYRWQLDGSNDWWMDFDEKTQEFLLIYRYSNRVNDVYLQSLQTAIPWLLGCQDFNPLESE